MRTEGLQRPPRGLELRCRGWEQEGALRCLLNNLDPEVAENAAELVVYGGRGRAARSLPIDRRQEHDERRALAGGGLDADEPAVAVDDARPA